MSSKSSASSAKLAKVRSDRDAFFAAGKFYEALQLYKTLISRARMKKDWSLAIDTATEGAEALLAQGQSGAGGELALALLEIYTKTGAKCGEKEIRTVLELATAFPSAAASAPAAAASSPAASASPSEESTPFESKIAFLRAALKWSSAVAPAGAVSGSGHPDIHLALARTLRSIPVAADEDAAAGFAAAHQQYLRSGGSTALSQLTRLNPSAAGEWKAGVEYEEDCDLLCAWAAAGAAPSELDLFFARAVLQYLCVEDIAGANAVLAWLKQHRPQIAEQSALIHYVAFVTETVQRSGPNAGRLFDLLRSKYSLALSRDPNLESYVDRVAEVFLARPAQKGFMESLMSGIGAPQTAAAATAPQASPSPPAAAAAAASFDAPMASDVD